MARPKKYPEELLQRGVRLALESGPEPVKVFETFFELV
jgi:hypothetical protein